MANNREYVYIYTHTYNMYTYYIYTLYNYMIIYHITNIREMGILIEIVLDTQRDHSGDKFLCTTLDPWNRQS